ncbi:substrate-binding domain-containing protein [Streptosporangium sp. NPDC000396]|uniref:substrate-binding domain-containing protein n=1 Tax=Streptosporangium sp. NPDC000396 TaxID=3366185 RepID=UPI0036A9D501
MRTTRTAIVLTALLALSLSGCSRGGTQTSATGTAPASGKKDATIIMSTLGNPFFISVKDGAEAQAAKSGITLNVQNADNSDATFLNQATTAISKQTGILILDPVGSQSAITSVTQANSASIPVMAFDRKPSGGNLATFVGYNAVQAGKNAADALAKAVGGKGKVVEIQGILGTNVAQDRSKGFQQQIATYKDITVVAQQAADFDRAKALNVMTNVLQANPDIDGVYAANDEMAMGVLSAIKARNLVGKIKLVGNDGIADALAAVAAGEMYATNAESPYALGQKVVSLAGDVLSGKQVRGDETLEGQLVTKETVKKYAEYLLGIGDSASVPANLK